MQYQVLARKWRPQNFHEIVGQQHVSRTLVNALQSGRVAHAFLFSGPRGSGKTTTARILAKALNCHDGKPGEPCGRCVACVEIAAGNCLDVLEIDAASNRGIDEIRELKEKVRYNPARDKHKIFIIDEVHMLTTEAFNALLKTLEEPPPHVAFIMATTEYHKIPATILSRCQQYSFKLIQYPLILERLKKIAGAEKIQISNTALEQVAFSSGGSMRDATSALDQVIAFSGDVVRDEDVTMLLGLVEPQVLAKTVRAIAANESDRILEVVGGIVENGQDLQNFCRRLLAQFRNIMVLKAGVSEPSLLGVPESLVPELRSQAGLFSREDLLRVFDALLKVEADLKQATQVRFQLEMGLIEVAHLPRLRSLEELIADFTRLVQGDLPPKSGTGQAQRSQAERSSTVPERATETKITAPAPVSQERPEPQKRALGGRELVLQIASRIEKASLEPILQGVSSADLQGDDVILDVETLNDFLRRQLRENLPVIAHAATSALGRPVKVLLGGEHPKRAEFQASPPVDSPPADKVEDILERAKREPLVKSFLEVFPGPVKAEKIDR
jgi:DNA polymerase-3 subunit gamma/tau